MSRPERALVLMVIAGFFAILGSTMSKAPTLPLYAKALGLTRAEIGIVAAASTITGILVNFLSGLLSDIYGRKKLLLVSGTVFLTAPLLYFLTRNAASLALVRAYYGIATAVFVPVSLALISDIYPSRRGAFMGLLSSSTLVGRALAPVLAGTLIYLIGFPPVFILCATTGLIALSLMSFLPSAEGERVKGRRAFKRVISVYLVPIGVVDAVIYMAYQGIETFLPLFYVLTGKEWLAGLILTAEIAIMAVVKPAAGYLSDKIGRIKPIIMGLILTSISMFMLATSSTLEWILASAILFAFAASVTTASTKPLAADIARYRGAALGLLESIKDVGQATGPIVVGALGVREGYLVIGILALISLPMLLLTIGRQSTVRPRER